MTFPCKESLIELEILAKKQKRIYPDSADCGILITPDNTSEINTAREALRDLMNFYGYKALNWGNPHASGGKSVSLFIPIEAEEVINDAGDDMDLGYAGVAVDVTYNRDATRKVEFITIAFIHQGLTPKRAKELYNCKVL